MNNSSFWQIQLRELAIVLKFLTKNDKLKIVLLILAQLVFTGIDLFGIALFSLAFGLITTNGELAEGGRLSKFLEILPLDHFSGNQQTLVIGLTALFALIIKSTASLLLSKRIFSFFALRAAYASEKLLQDLVSGTVSKLERYSLQNVIFATTEGVQTLFVRGFANFIIIVSEIVLIAAYFVILTTINPVLSILLLFYFVLITCLILKTNVGPAKAMGRYATKLQIESAELTAIIVENYRTLFVTQKLEMFVKQFSGIRLRLMQTLAKRISQAATSKYILELSFIFSILLMAMFLFTTNSASSALVILSVFIGASFRITPSILRVQQEYLNLRSSLSSVRPTISMLNEFMTTSIELVPQLITSSGTPISSFVPKIEAQNIYFRFSEEASFALKNLNFKIAPGTLTAIVGPSGAGKSTLFDIILGIRKPNEGMILLSGLEPNLAIKKWRNCVSFVPQDLYVFPGSIRENILLELGVNNNDQDLEKAIRQSGLEEMLDWPLGLDTQIGQSGVQLSGGQRQRLAIARALVSDPKLILMDEPTSSLDAITEQRVFADLEALRRDRTLVVIAHRLSTVRNADSIIYLDGGEIRSIGTFDETRKNIPEFEKQAQLLGIS